MFPERKLMTQSLPVISKERKPVTKTYKWAAQLFKHGSHTGCRLYVLHGPACLWTFSMKLQQLAVSGLDWCWYGSMKGLTKALLC